MYQGGFRQHFDKPSRGDLRPKDRLEAIIGPQPRKREIGRWRGTNPCRSPWRVAEAEAGLSGESALMPNISGSGALKRLIQGVSKK